VSDFGAIALRLAFFVAIAGAVAGVVAGRSNDDALAAFARRAVQALAVLVSVALGALLYAFATLDFQLVYVATNAARSMALPYRMAALWGGQAGSLVLWTWMTAIYALAATTRHRDERALMPWVCALLLANCAFFLGLSNFVPNTNPFEKLPASHVLSDGNGLNPLLQHPVMMIHPLVLYTGMTGFSVPFAFALAALLSGRLGAAWLRVTRRWTLWAWCFLSIGILLGGRWAYEVLGWGGYWAWDPVENASFMPWIAGTAYLHSVMVQEKRDMLKIWNFVLIGLTYGLCLFGTMITRSGLVRSVHAFAQTEIFGQLFLAYVTLALATFFGALFYRAKALRAPNRLESVLSREAGFVINNWLFMALLGIVFFGTLFPKLSPLFFGEEILVGPKYFNGLGAFVALPLLLLTGIGPLIAWRRATPSHLRRQLVAPVAVGTVVFLALVARLGVPHWLASATWGLAALVSTTIGQEFFRAVRARMARGERPATALATLFRKNQRRYGGYVVHLGVVCLFIGFAGAAINEERLENLAPGGRIEIGGYRLEYRTARPLVDSHYGGAVAHLALFRGETPLATLAPEKRMYWVEQQPSSIPAIYSTLGEDLYVILTAIEPNGSATLKVYLNPLVNWVWLGGFTFVIGTLLVMWPHEARARAVPSAEAAPAGALA
jgi:cytochrome c-type biogenesis protein CcmF